MKKITLNGAWSLRGKSQCSQEENIICIDAQVPGCAQLDLSKAGYLPEDLFLGENIRETEKYEDTNGGMNENLTPRRKEKTFILCLRVLIALQNIF